MRLSLNRATAAAVALPAGLFLLGGSVLPPAMAQEDAISAPVLDVVEITPTVHLIAGDGGNIVMQHGSDGVVLVDAGTGARAEEVLAIIEGFSPEPIRFIINTTADSDHVGGNGTLSAAGVVLGGGRRRRAPAVVSGVRDGAARLAHENVLLRMSAPAGQVAAYEEALWPTEGFIDRKNLYLNGEAIQVIHQPAARSDGDSIVFFRRSDVIATGPIIDTTRFPHIDVSAGGTVQGLIDALNVVVELAIPPTPLVWQEGGTRVVPGRGRIMEQADVVEYRDMVTIVRDVVQQKAAAGMTLEQVLAEAPTRGYTRRYGAETGPWTTDMFVEAIYRTLGEEGSR